MRIVTLALLLLLVVPAWASEPGQPLDCTDMVFEVPGLTCTTVVPMGTMEVDPLGLPAEEINQFWERAEHRLAVDNSGALYIPRLIWYPQDGDTANRMEIWKHDGQAQERIAHIQGNRVALGIGRDYIGHGAIQFDAVQGRLLVWLRSRCTQCESPETYGGYWIAAIEGLGALVDVYQSYEPTTNSLGFAVPRNPEGFQYSDYFDTYWGDLATVGDWSQAQPLQCAYPATAPSVGDYLTVEDTLPSPAPGRGHYYVTAVNYQGQRRYGRQSNGGALTGRNPAVLPSCSE